MLHDQVQPFLHRRSADILRQALPPKYETALACRLTPVQRRLYTAFLEHVKGEEGVKGEGRAPGVRRLIGGYQTMQQIFNHPSTLYRNLDAQGAASKRTAAGYDSMDDFVVTLALTRTVTLSP